MSDVASAAGISRQALYLHFPSRTELLLATMEHVRGELGVTSAYQRILATDDPDAVLTALMELHASFTPRITGIDRVLEGERQRDPVLESAWQNRDQSRINLMRGVVDRFAAAGRLSPEWPAEEAAEWLWALTSPSFVEKLQRRGWKPDDITRHTRRSIEATLLRSD
jgi:AcrR family transcriptional regulator